MEKVPLIPLPSLQERIALRKRMGLSYRKAAIEIGTTYRTLWRWEQQEEQQLHLTAESHRKYQTALRRWKQIIDNFQ